MSGSTSEHFSQDLRWYTFDRFEQYSHQIIHGMFTRKGGVSTGSFHSLNGGSVKYDNPAAITENRRRVSAALGNAVQWVSTHPIHGTHVLDVTPDSIANWQQSGDHREEYPPEHLYLLSSHGDAMMTRMAGIGLVWAFADCAPIMLFDPETRAIALVHAGWRGMSRAIVVETIQAMQNAYGAQPSHLIAGIGPTIGPCCYEVDDPVFEAFAAHPIAGQYMSFSTHMITDAGGEQRTSLRLNLADACIAQLQHAGVLPENIEIFPLCTGCHPELFYSFRKEQRQTGRHFVVIGLR